MARRQEEKSFNIWKWAFILTVLFLLLGVGWLGIRFGQLSQGQEISVQSEENLEEDDDEVYTLQVTMTTDETQRLLNDYLQSIQMEGPDLQVLLKDRIEVHGNVEVLGRFVPFTLFLVPEVLDSGNVTLHVDQVQVSSLSLPISIVMNLLLEFLEFPSWINVDTANQKVYVNLDQVVFEDILQVKVLDFDLAEENIQVEFKLSEDILKE